MIVSLSLQSPSLALALLDNNGLTARYCGDGRTTVDREIFAVKIFSSTTITDEN